MPNNFASSLLPLGVKTKIDGKLNLTRVLFDIYPPEQLIEISLYDANRTKFAYIHNDLGGTTKVANSNRPMPAFWSRLKVISGSLMLTGIQKKDNGTKIISKAQLTDIMTKRARRSKMSGPPLVKTIQILVHSPGNFHFVGLLISANSFK